MGNLWRERNILQFYLEKYPLARYQTVPLDLYWPRVLAHLGLTRVSMPVVCHHPLCLNYESGILLAASTTLETCCQHASNFSGVNYMYALEARQAVSFSQRSMLNCSPFADFSADSSCFVKLLLSPEGVQNVFTENY